MPMITHASLTVALAIALLAPPVLGQEPARPAGRTIQVNGADIYYEQHGTGDALVLLHGFGACGRDWAPFVPDLARHFTVIVPDLRGHGSSTNPKGAFTHRQSAADVFALLDHLDVKRFRAMGISTGGMTLLHMATQQPARVDAMVLIGATHYFPEPARATMRQWVGGAPADAIEFLRRCTTRESQAEELSRQFAAFKDSYDDMNFTPPFLRIITARTLIVHGDRDEFFPVSIPTEMYAAIPNVALWIVPFGGHVPIFGPNAPMFREIALRFLQMPAGPGGEQRR